MRASIQPVSTVPGDLLRDHLRNYGLPSEIVRWKYFDEGFRPKGERGWVWLKEGKVKGLIGLLPFTLASRNVRLSCAWTCDWFVEDAAKHPGIGALLLKEAADREGLLVTLGGNEATARMVPRLAAVSVPEAAVGLTLPLRLAGTRVFRALSARLPMVAPLGKVPLRRSAAARRGFKTDGGVASSLGAVLESAAEGDSWRPLYDFGYVKWQLERCPVLESFTVYAQDQAVPTAAVAWRPKAGLHWRLAFWTRGDDAEMTRAVVEEVVARVYAAGGASVSALTGRDDQASLAILTSAGFRQNDLSLPLYVLARERPAPIERVSALGYTDSDLSYRF